jgi:predicted Zn-dependent protease with MMP-like domain
MGLYRGLPIGEEAEPALASGAKPVPPALASARSAERAPPRAIVLYRKNLARAVRSRSELDRQIRRTLVHEIGHLRGLDEDELRRLGLD